MKENTILVVTSLLPILLLTRTMWALGGLWGVTFILSARGLWSLRRRQLPR